MASFRVLGVDHLGIVPRDAGGFAQLMATLGLHSGDSEHIADQQTTVTCFHHGDESGLGRLEALVADSPESPIGRYQARVKGGIHHVALRVDDIDAALNSLDAAGVPLIDRQARIGEGGSRVAFLHPRGAGGILVELVERKGVLE